MHKLAFINGFLLGSVQNILCAIIGFILFCTGFTKPILLLFCLLLYVVSFLAMSKYLRIYKELDSELEKAKIFEPIDTPFKQKLYQTYAILSITLAGLIWKIKSYFKR